MAHESNPYWNFRTAARLAFGVNLVDQIGSLVNQQGWKKAYLVTDENLAKVGIVQRVVDSLKQGNIDCDVFSGGQAEPEIAVGDAAIDQGRKFGPDVVIGLGGGSNMDVAKFVVAALTHGGQSKDYFGIEKVPGSVMPLVCVPTTSGTGSEVSHAAVLTDTENEIKLSSLSQYLRPAIALVDPSLTYRCPKQIMADSGIDALTHAIEAVTAVGFDKLQIPSGEVAPYEGSHPLGDCLGDRAIELIGRYLEPAVNDPEDLEAKNQLSYAATLAGMAFSNCSVALVHAMEYPLGGMLHCSHGAGNGLLLPYIMQFFKSERLDVLARIARLMGVDTSNMSVDQAAQSAIDAVTTLREKIGIPMKIREIGGKEEQIPVFAEKAFAIKRLIWFTPRNPSLQDIEHIYQEAM